jgi:hypothetical protein
MKFTNHQQILRINQKFSKYNGLPDPKLKKYYGQDYKLKQ